MGVLDGKVAVVTGSSRGLGSAIAEAYARAGAAVVFSARDTNKLALNVRVLTAQGLKASSFACDVGNLEQVQALAAHAVQTFGKIDIWVNNAGISGVFGPTAAQPVESFESALQTNIHGTYHGSIVALEYFLAQRSGKLINLLGRGDDRPVPFQNSYAPTKAWVRSFTLALAQEYKESGVGIYAFNPGLVDTDMLRKIDAIAGYENKLARFGTIIQMWANPPSVPAQRALWLASAATDGKTGLEIKLLNRATIFKGIGKLVRSKLTRKAMPGDGALEITSIQPEARQDGGRSV